MSRFALFAVLLASVAAVPMYAQQEGAVPTQALVTLEGKSGGDVNLAALTLSVNEHKQPLTNFKPIDPAKTQVALLMDSGLRVSVGRELDELRSFVRSLPDGVEVMVGSMQYGSVRADQPFTTNHDAAAQALHLPQGMAGGSASPYLCLSDFVKKWPEGGQTGDQSKSRLVLMITNGVDPYNGSTSLMNQDSPYVAAAVTDAQRAGVAVYSIYYGDAGIRGGRASMSGQSYLSQVAEGTGGRLFYEGMGSPVSMKPFFDQFRKILGETYIASFNAPVHGHDDLVRIKVSGSGVKAHAPEAVRPGNRE
ncbi:MAG TPA: hypothetical protein VHU44_08275 [Acidobacteriaceae bacterium]|jgi:hypothetical protein|nr:hypothetical protein [Acidobacteriaceae bacterium]